MDEQVSVKNDAGAQSALDRKVIRQILHDEITLCGNRAHHFSRNNHYDLAEQEALIMIGMKEALRILEKKCGV